MGLLDKLIEKVRDHNDMRRAIKARETILEEEHAKMEWKRAEAYLRIFDAFE